MNDRDALIAAISAHPREDTPRLALADWLDEHGKSSRAEFVRLQCRAARLRAGTVPRANALRAADDLRAEHEADWLGAWASRLVSWEYRRGFVWTVRMTANQFLAHGDELFRTEPVQRLELLDEHNLAFDGTPNPLAAEVVREVVAHPAFAHVRDCAVVPARFFLNETPVSAWLSALAVNLRVTRLRRFGAVGTFSFNFDAYQGRPPTRGVTREALEAFCSAAHLRTLQTLDLSQCPIIGETQQDTFPKLLSTATFARSLRTLELENCSLSPGAIARIGADTSFRRLRALNLHRNSLDPDVYRPIFASTTLTAVTRVAISGREIPAYAPSPLARQVRDLTVHAAEIDEAEGQTAWFALLKNAPPPHRLRFRCYDPGRPVFHEMYRRKWLRAVRALSISGDSQSEAYSEDKAGVCSLFRGDVMPRLSALSLHEVGNRKVLAALANWPGVAHLESLVLTDDYHGRFTPTEFPTTHPMTCLRDLQGVVISTDEDVDQFLALPGLENLASLQLSFLGHYDRTTHRYTDAVTLKEAAVDRVLRSERLSRLTTLTLGFGYTRRIEFHVVPQFADPALMPRLQQLRLYVSRDGSSNDRVALGRVRVRFGLRLVAW